MSKLKALLPITVTLVVILLFYYTKITTLKFYPIIVNFVFFAVFFYSCFKGKPIIQKIAETIDGKLHPKIIIYTRNLNYICTIITGINFTLSVITLYMNNTFWALYNGCISYFIIGAVFLIEYPVRIWYKGKISNGK